jgi:type VI secretion system secreted protein Hcp
MAFDAFFYFTASADKEKVPGETLDAAMADKSAFEMISFSFGAENNINIGSASGGGGAGKATFKEFNITKKTDLGSPGLFQQLCVGRHFDEAIVELRRSGGSTTESGSTFMKFHFKHVMVQDIEWSGSDGDDVCEESITFQYGAMKVEYIPQKADGSMDTSRAKKAEWSRVKNTAQYAV